MDKKKNPLRSVMTGIAQKLFLERRSKTLPTDFEKHSEWPLLDLMLRAKRLGYVDLALANQLLGSNADESVAALACHLSLASRLGHVCVVVENGMITPSVDDVWTADDTDLSELVSAKEIQRLTQLIIQGTEKACVPLAIIRNDHSFYLHRFWHLETFFLKSFQRLRSPSGGVCFSIDQEIVDNEVKALVEQQKLLKEQAAAISIASQSPLTIITGGPGTGKTYTAGICFESSGKQRVG